MTPEQEKESLSYRLSRVFTPSAPIDEQALFAGRIEQLRKVVDAVNQRGQHAIIFGERGVGKTSLARVLASKLTGRAGLQVLSPHVNCDSADTHAGLWRKVLAEIWLAKQTSAAGFGSQGETLTSTAAESLPENPTVEDIRRIVGGIAQQAVLLLIVDEFDRLSNPADRRMFADTIKTLSDHATPATLVLVGVADTVEQLIGEHQSVERALKQIPMPRMSPDELEQIVYQGLARLEMQIDPDAVARIAVLSQGLPHYTHLLALHAGREAIDRGDKVVTLEDVDAAIRTALEETQASVVSAYTKATRSPRKDSLFEEVLLACSLADERDDLGFFTAKAVQGPMSRVTKKYCSINSFTRHLNEFSDVKRGPILERVGLKRSFRYRFVNPLMQPYITMRGVRDGLVTWSELNAGGAGFKGFE